MTGRHRTSRSASIEAEVGLDIIEDCHHVESWMSDATAGEVHRFGAQCFVCPWGEETGSFDEADKAADRHREETRT